MSTPAPTEWTFDTLVEAVAALGLPFALPPKRPDYFAQRYEPETPDGMTALPALAHARGVPLPPSRLLPPYSAITWNQGCMRRDDAGAAFQLGISLALWSRFMGATTKLRHPDRARVMRALGVIDDAR